MSFSQRCIIVHPYEKRHAGGSRSPEARLEEACGLALAIQLQIVAKTTVPLSQRRPATLMGAGKIEELRQIVEAEEIALAIIDAPLSPVQQRNLEEAWKCKVIDRTALILEIFGARARTSEGKLQVELAALEYQKSRLVRSWTHLERQRGGFGFLGGPGESQIEIDRRLIRDRIARIKRELEKVVRTRELHRKQRRDTPYPIVALVGYTNAGKSTLFNRLTRASVVAEDQLFATLDPTLRALKLASGLTIMLSDTVGFVSDLPHELVAAFRATLEEVMGADTILHVRDIAHPDSDAQAQDVYDVLDGLFHTPDYREHTLEIWNKIDLLSAETRHALSMAGAQRHIALSALTGEGMEPLLHWLDTTLSDSYFTQRLTLCIPSGDGKTLAWLHAHGQVVSSEPHDDHTLLTVKLSPKDAARFTKMTGIATGAA